MPKTKPILCIVILKRRWQHSFLLIKLGPEGYFEYGNFEFENGNFEKQSGELETKWGTKNKVGN